MVAADVTASEATTGACNAATTGVIFFCLENYGAEGGIRTPTPYGATPSRWCVCQFRHFRTKGG
jgi:hypothetical protein